MVLSEELKREIVNSIRENAEVKDIILFGSYAYGHPHKWSDVDLLIILNKKGFTKSYREMLEQRSKISSLLMETMKKIPIDVLVYSEDEWEYLVSTGNYFHKEIKEKGIHLS